MRTGAANLPLHYGKAPAWLFKKMADLAREITFAVVKEFSAEEMLNRLSDPFFFQSFACVLGFDWHSSGLTTTTMGALKDGIGEYQSDLGLFICGGKGGTSRKTPSEIENNKFINPIQISKLIYASKMSAKIDNTALQDGYQLYHHNFVFTKAGKWAVVQQGMNEKNKYARRYHWLSDEVKSFTNEPEKAICCNQKESKVLNLVARQSNETRKASVYASRIKPDKTLKNFSKIKKLSLKTSHPVSILDIKPENLNRILLKTYEQQPENFEKLLAITGVGPKTIRALSLISELVYNAAPSFSDPVRFSFAHGGKDGYPYPVDRQNYQNSIEFLKEAVNKAKIGNSDKLKALKRLSLQK